MSPRYIAIAFISRLPNTAFADWEKYFWNKGIKQRNRTKILSATYAQFNGILIDVEVHITKGLPSFSIVGLPDTIVKESKERVKAAIQNTGIEFKSRKIVVNLAPAYTKKEGPAFDLPIAIGRLMSMGIIENQLLD